MNTRSPTAHARLTKPWLALVIGNSRLHWAHFIGPHLQATWDTPHLSTETVDHLVSHRFDFAAVWRLPLWETAKQLPSTAKLPLPAGNPIPSLNLQQPDVWIASVVPQQAHLWRTYAAAQFVTLEHIPLNELYPTLGIDRALAVWGAIDLLGGPVLVIDAGTALTFTAADGNHRLIGGAILPGLSLQFQALGQKTAALPLVQFPDAEMPPRWALSTEDAIASGILYTLLASMQEFIHAWWRQFPDSPVVLTGGDGDRLYRYLKQQTASLANQVSVEPSLVFWGMRAIWQKAGNGWETDVTSE